MTASFMNPTFAKKSPFSENTLDFQKPGNGGGGGQDSSQIKVIHYWVSTTLTNVAWPLQSLDQTDA